ITVCFFIYPKFDENNNKIRGYIYSNRNVYWDNITFSFTDLNEAVSDADSNLSLQFNYKYFK
ncbi:MAG: hypothetical protein IJI98_08400, partial [Methanosphaera sp.]|nr:hypothetical protein [Methanosphaera sp.]